MRGSHVYSSPLFALPQRPDSDSAVSEMTQLPTRTCDACAADVPVTPAEGGYEFEWRCQCGLAGSISWAHSSPPPTFEAARQGNLFV